MAEKQIKINQACIGLRVHLDLNWLEHPFLLSNFTIRNAKQLQVLKNLGLKEISYDPDRSTVSPLSDEDNTQTGAANKSADKLIQEMWDKKKSQIKHLQDRRSRLYRCQTLYGKSVETLEQVNKGMLTSSKISPETVKMAQGLVNGMVKTLISDQEVTLHMVNAQGRKRAENFHSVNVAVLSLLLGKKLGLNSNQLQSLAMGAVFHDLGKLNLPPKIRDLTRSLEPDERKAYQLHPKYSVDILKRASDISGEVLKIAAQHHEHVDGSGFPNRLPENKISLLAKIVAITNRYDNLCNSVSADTALSPFEAVSHLYKNSKGKYDDKLVSLFISSIGIYPPGTLVELTDGRIGVVMAINPGKLLYPNILIYDPKIPPKEAPIIDLSEEGDAKVNRAIKAAAFPKPVLEYLNPGISINYYFDSGTAE